MPQPRTSPLLAAEPTGPTQAGAPSPSPRANASAAGPSIAFKRLAEIPAETLLAHMSDPRVSAHLPLAPPGWSLASIQALVAAKEQAWTRDGLGHWAITVNDVYAGWGGFQREDGAAPGEWDFGLVLRAEMFGHGQAITRAALAFARADPRIACATFLLPLSRTRLAALARLGAEPMGEITLAGARFRKFRLPTT